MMRDEKHKDLVQQINKQFAQLERLLSQAKTGNGGRAPRPKFLIINGGKTDTKSGEQSEPS